MAFSKPVGGSSGGNFQPLDAELTALSSLTSSANTVPYFTGSGTADLTTLTAAGRSFLDDADSEAQRLTIGLKTFYPNGTDRAAIQDALDAAEAAGGGIVQLDYGTYSITTVNSPASGDKGSGAYGLEIPSNVILQGMGDGTILSIVAGGVFGVGCGISPKGMRTATSNFGASTNVVLRDFKIVASTQDDSSGNLLNLVHASYWYIYRLNIAGSIHHGIELDQSKYILVKDCRFTGSYSSATSGSWIQFDYGSAGPCNRPASITTRSVEDILIENCIFSERTGDTSNREIDMTHNASELVLERITFRNNHFTFRNQAALSCIYFDQSGGTTSSKIRDILFEGNTFVTQHPTSQVFALTDNTGRQIDGITIKNNVFKGTSAALIWMFGTSTATTTYATTYRRGLEILDNTIYFDKTGLGASTDYNLFALHQWASLKIKNNKIIATGDFGGGVTGTSYCSVMRLGNNIDLTVEDNEIIWGGNNVTVGRTCIYISQENCDQAGTTVRTSVNNNVLRSEIANWSYGVLLQCGTTVPSNRIFSFKNNHSNGAGSAQDQILYTGPTGAGAASEAGLALAVRSVSANATLTQQDGILMCDTSSGNITITALHAQYRQTFQLIKTSAANSLTFGSTTVTALGATILVYSNGTTNYSTATHGGGTLAIADGGTAATTASAARTNLGLVIGTDVLSPTGVGSGITAINASNISAGTLSNSRLNAGVLKKTLTIDINGNGSAITTGRKGGVVTIPHSATIDAWSISAAGTNPTCTFDVWKLAASSALPTVADSIIATGLGGVKPALSSGNSTRYTSTLSNWTTAINAGDRVAVNLDAVNAAAEKITFTLEYSL